MYAKSITHKGHEIIHWLWLWTLAIIAISVLRGTALGQESQAVQPSTPVPAEVVVDGQPMPIPNVDAPDLFRYPQEFVNPNRATMGDVLDLNRSGEFQRVIKAWQTLRVMDDSVTWKHVGIGVAHFRLDELEEALKSLERAVEEDRTNAVAEYFLGQVRRQQSREVPFWFEMKEDAPFRFAAHYEDRSHHLDRSGRIGGSGKTLPPPFSHPDFDSQAAEHFRRAIDLAPKCDLDRTINVVQPVVQFADRSLSDRPTVRDLLISLGEANYVEKARRELGERLSFDQ